MLEVLIATVAFAIVLASINAVFYSAVRLRNHAAESIDRALPLEHALTIMKRDLANVVPPEHGPFPVTPDDRPRYVAMVDYR